MTEVYIFDCDGVIINSAQDIAASVNAALEHFGYWTVSEKTLASFTGDGSRNLIKRALAFSARPRYKSLQKKFDEEGIPDSKVEPVLEWYKEYYYSHAVVKTTLYAGIPELLKVLKEKGKKVGMLTNKPTEIAERILKHFSLDIYFDFVTGPEYIKNMKPSPEGLEFTVGKINGKYGTDYTNDNVIMIGDSAVDIMAGKAYGCKTCGITGGIGDRTALLAQNPDLTFSVAGEIEKYIDILSSEKEISAIKTYAMKNAVPIMQNEGIDFICSYIREHNVKNVLEIGSAIGYSAIKFAEVRENVKVTTIEIDLDRFIRAKENVREHNLDDRITLINADALQCEVDGTFDLIFIDAAKAQYIKFFEKYKMNLAPEGVIISDNLLFHGMVEDLSLTHNYSTIKLVKKIRKYRDFLQNNSEFDTVFYTFGDGISVSRRHRAEI